MNKKNLAQNIKFGIITSSFLVAAIGGRLILQGNTNEQNELLSQKSVQSGLTKISMQKVISISGMGETKNIIKTYNIELSEDELNTLRLIPKYENKIINNETIKVLLGYYYYITLNNGTSIIGQYNPKNGAYVFEESKSKNSVLKLK